MPISEAYIISHSPERNRSTILGIYYFLSRGGPGLIMPLIGHLIDEYGYYTSFNAVGATMAVVTIGCFLFLRGSRD
jgi:MFS family permease